MGYFVKINFKRKTNAETKKIQQHLGEIRHFTPIWCTLKNKTNMSDQITLHQAKCEDQVYFKILMGYFCPLNYIKNIKYKSYLKITNQSYSMML